MRKIIAIYSPVVKDIVAFITLTSGSHMVVLTIPEELEKRTTLVLNWTDNAKRTVSGGYVSFIRDVFNEDISVEVAGVQIDVAVPHKRGLGDISSPKLSINLESRAWTHECFCPDKKAIQSMFNSLRKKFNAGWTPSVGRSLEDDFSEHASYIVRLLQSKGLTPSGDVNFETISSLFDELIQTTGKSFDDHCLSAPTGYDSKGSLF